MLRLGETLSVTAFLRIRSSAKAAARGLVRWRNWKVKGMNSTFALFFLVSSVTALNPRQRAEVKRIEQSLLAPCCYSQPVAQHMSAEAERMRREITEMVAPGRGEPEIIDHYKALYGERILVIPDGKTGQILLGLPMTISTLGSVLFALIMQKMLRARAAPRAAFEKGESDCLLRKFCEETERQMGDKA